MIISGAKLKTIILVFSVLHLLHSLNNKTFAQNTSSPYSRYGVGDVNSRVYGQGFAMGGTSIAMQNDTTPLFFINSTNPASYSGVYLTTAELGMNYNRLRLQSADTKKNINNASFGYVSIAFPIKKWIGASFGLVPFSSVGYNLADTRILDNIGRVNYKYEGNGGMSQAYFGLGFKPLSGLPKIFRNSAKYARLKAENRPDRIIKIMNHRKSLASLSLGGNVSYLFGSIEHLRASEFTSANTFNTRSTTTTRFNDVYFDYGIQYAHTIDSLNGRDLKDNVKIMFGATFAAQTDVNARIDSLAVNYFNSSAGFDIVKDTVEFVEGHKGSVTLPLSFGFGIGLKKGTRWMLAADFAMQNWSSYQAFNQTQGLKNSMRVSAGAQFVPNAKSSGIKTYFRRVHYRVGGRYAQTALELKSSQLTEYAVSFGMGFPVAGNYLLKSFSMVNIGVEVGQRGTTTNGLIREEFFKSTLSFTINDRWFQKTRID
ncbi:MAG TPA: hypothetical protein VF868_11415 [Bacteroidia bacterium]|jgi:hypothetical protein